MSLTMETILQGNALTFTSLEAAQWEMIPVAEEAQEEGILLRKLREAVPMDTIESFGPRMKRRQFQTGMIEWT